METWEEEALAGRSVVITGAGGGIGSVLVWRFLTLGARVFAVDRDRDALDRLRAEHGKSAKLSTAMLDVSDKAQCRNFAARVRSDWKVGRADQRGRVFSADSGPGTHLPAC